MTGGHRAIRGRGPQDRILRRSLVSVAFVLIAILALRLFRRGCVTFGHFGVPDFNVDLLFEFDILFIQGQILQILA